jgi:hypothetical protein
MSDQAVLPLDGGCQCGAVRYRIAVRPAWVGYCHCRMCQKAHGAPVVAWLAAAANKVTFIKGELKFYASSSHVDRGFCPACGTPVACVPTPAPGKTPTIDLAVATLDDPTAVSPREHFWCDSAMPWMPISDQLPRHPQGPPPSPGG